ncbi:MAG: hypothetical protein DMF92_00505 [Acidobacteria bacterium]|nr:MAG: hypothetical protein DMF92_00505 [Acidobacteriota bacterium]
MPAFGRFGLAAAVVASLTVGGCGAPPDKEIDQAQGAIDAAGAAGADQYAHEEFLAAQEALKHAHEAVDARDYRLALNHALDSREHAQSAAKEAADHKAMARSEAERALGDITAVLTATHAKLKAAETARAPAKTLAEARRVIADTEGAVQKARAAFDRGDYLAVPVTIAGVTRRLAVTAHSLDAVAVPAVKRRR